MVEIIFNSRFANGQRSASRGETVITLTCYTLRDTHLFEPPREIYNVPKEPINSLFLFAFARAEKCITWSPRMVRTIEEKQSADGPSCFEDLNSWPNPCAPFRLLN